MNVLTAQRAAEDPGAPAAQRRQQRIEELCAATIRALTGDPALRFRGRRLARGDRLLPIGAPHLHPSLDDDDPVAFRGAADGLALRITGSDAALHARLAPADPVERLLFELLEQYRVEALAPWPGMRRNLRHLHERWSLAFHHSGLTDTASGLLVYTVLQITRARVTGEPVVEETEDLMEATRAGIAPAFGHDLEALRRLRDDQSAFAPVALRIAARVAQMLRDAQAAAGAAGRDWLSVASEQAAASERGRGRFVLIVPGDGDEVPDAPLAPSGRSPVLDAAAGYRVFSRAWDRELPAATLVRPAQLREQRERLDARIAAQGIGLARLARALRWLLARPARDGWDAAQDEGRIDGRALARLVASPTERRLFVRDREPPVADAAVCLLIDCSGSMKAQAESVALLADVLARALDMAGVQNEVLGFTTGAWNGGRALRDWQRAGRPGHPGRLNERCHLVFKDADTSWRRARPGIAALLQPTLFREGIDGEAVDWACTRLRARDVSRRLLLVVSDGCPMDSATQLANDAFYLEQHLRQVVARQEADGGVQILGLGVGLDLSPYYRASRVLDLAAGVRNAVFDDLLDLLGRAAVRGPAGH